LLAPRSLGSYSLRAEDTQLWFRYSSALGNLELRQKKKKRKERKKRKKERNLFLISIFASQI